MKTAKVARDNSFLVDPALASQADATALRLVVVHLLCHEAGRHSPSFLNDMHASLADTVLSLDFENVPAHQQVALRTRMTAGIRDMFDRAKTTLRDPRNAKVKN